MLASAFAGVTTDRAYGCALSPYTSHCYSVAEWSPSPSLHGVSEYLQTFCLNGTAPNFATSEYWIGTDNDTTQSYWIEQGIIDGGDITGSPHQFTWFWETRPPGKDYEFHIPGVTAAPGTEYATSIRFVSGSTWEIRRSGTTLATTPFSPPSGLWATTGAEYTENSAETDGLADVLAWEDTGDNWYNNWSSVLVADPKLRVDKGSASWITRNQELQWAFNC